jgi:hypothetical protein
MKLIVLFFLVPLVCLGETPAPNSLRKEKIQSYLQKYYEVEELEPGRQSQFFSFLQKLSEKKATLKSEALFLSHTFYRTHQRFLRNYQEFSNFSNLFSSGSYNCLSATALYALILDYFNYEYQIVETNYHIFVLINTNEGIFLFETTDGQNGFVSSPRKVQEKIASYKKNVLSKADDSKTYYSYRSSLYNEITLDQLTGLFHYNLAVQAFNDRDETSAVRHLEESVKTYYSPRTEELSRIILLSLQYSKTPAADPSLKSRVRRISKTLPQVMASL